VAENQLCFITHFIKSVQSCGGLNIKLVDEDLGLSLVFLPANSLGRMEEKSCGRHKINDPVYMLCSYTTSLSSQTCLPNCLTRFVK
jgi:hypothetical protein